MSLHRLFAEKRLPNWSVDPEISVAMPAQAPLHHAALSAALRTFFDEALPQARRSRSAPTAVRTHADPPW
jgi:hypothetical protein